MPILLKPYLGCNLQCEYCYEKNYRKKHNPRMDYDLSAVLKAMEEQYQIGEQKSFGLHGGEPLCIPKEDVEALLNKSYELTKCSSIETNATLIDKDFIELFKKYNTHVGISLDGPGELSKYRMSARKADKINELIPRLIKEGLGVSVIAVISKSNAETLEQQRKFKGWLLDLKELGVGGRINPCAGGGSAGYELNMNTLTEFYLDLANFCIRNGVSWSPLSDMSLRMRDKGAVCVFMGCDLYHTNSATVILGDGSITNCMRTNQGDIILRHPAKYGTREELLQEIPQEYGGCQDCEFWYACHGGCPSEAIDGDWRNRTHLCPMYKELFKFYGNLMKAISLEKTESSKKQPGHRDIHRDTPHVDIKKHTDTGGKR
ncbi:Anaerobic sulfatase-maturating enzyme [subsurface metagenome]